MSADLSLSRDCRHVASDAPWRGQIDRDVRRADPTSQVNTCEAATIMKSFAPIVCDLREAHAAGTER